MTHAVGIIASVAGAAVLLAVVLPFGSLWPLLSTVVYSLSVILLYSASTCYHVARQPLRKARLRLVDHCAIYVMIAGTYTPFTIGVLQDPWGWTLLGVVWSLALGGIVYKVILLGRFPRISTALYLAMGWLALAALPLMLHALSVSTMLWLLAGGAAYTVGTLFFHSRRIPYSHAIWHGFVLVGSGCHFAAVLTQVLSFPVA